MGRAELSRGVRALRRFERRISEEAGAGIALRHAVLESDRPARGGAAASRRIDRRAAPRRRLFSRGADAGGPLPECLSRYIQLEPLDAVSGIAPGSSAGLSPRFGLGGAQGAAIQHGFFFLPARVASLSFRGSG